MSDQQQSNRDEDKGEQGPLGRQRAFLQQRTVIAAGAESRVGQPRISSRQPTYRKTLIEQYRNRQRSAGTRLAARPVPANNWVPLGPSVVRRGQAANRPAVSGRVAGIAVAPGGQRVYVASANGGVWRSDDAGFSWVSTMEAFDLDPLHPQSDSLSCGAIALHPTDPNRVYVGTGEGNSMYSSGDGGRIMLAYFGVGAIRSDNAGASWEQENSAPGDTDLAGAAFYQMAVDPADGEKVVAATTVGLYLREPTTAGNYKWSRMAAGYFTSVVAAASAGQTVFYAASWGGPILSSTDGRAWSALGNGFPKRAPGHEIGRIGLAVRKTYAAPVYALVSNDNNQHLLGVWRYDLESGNWYQVKNAPEYLFGNDLTIAGQAWYDMAISIDPSNPDRVFLGGSTSYVDNNWSASLYRCDVSTLGDPANISYSMTPTYIGSDTHADVHVIEPVPGNSDQLWVGCDGGVFFTAEASANTPLLESRNVGLGTLTMEHMGIHPQDDALLYCGSQDNGTLRYTGEEVWIHSGPGDGGCVIINVIDPNRVLRVYTYNTVYRTKNGDQDQPAWLPVSVPIIRGEAVDFYPPLVGLPSPNNSAEADLVAFGSTRVWISEEFGDAWRSIPSNTYETDKLNGTITSLAFASARRIYAGTSTGSVYRLDRQIDSWTSKILNNAGSAGNLSLRLPVTGIAIDPADLNRASIYIALGGAGDYRHVWHFDGNLWEDRSGSPTNKNSQLLDVQHNAIVVDPRNPRTLYVGADIGVWISVDAGKTWEVFSYGLPDAAVLDLKLHAQARVLWAATYGRGVYEYKLDTAAARGVELYFRLDKKDRGRRQPVQATIGAPEPANSPDIKVNQHDSVVAQPQTKTLGFFEFVDQLPSSSILTKSVSTRKFTQIMVHVQAHNRGLERGDAVGITLLLAEATAGIPDLPADYASTIRNGAKVAGNGWQTVGTQTVSGVRADLPAVATFEVATDLLPAAGPNTNTAICLLALLHCPSKDEFTNVERSVAKLIAEDRKAASTLIKVVNQ